MSKLARAAGSNAAPADGALAPAVTAAPAAFSHDHTRTGRGGPGRGAARAGRTRVPGGTRLRNPRTAPAHSRPAPAVVQSAGTGVRAPSPGARG